MVDIFSKFPEDKHYAILDFENRDAVDNEGWYVGCNTVKYIVLSYDDLIEWVKNVGDSRKYYIIEAERLEVTVPKPIIQKKFKYEMPPHLEEQMNDILKRTEDYVKQQRELINSISDPLVRQLTIDSLKDKLNGG